MRAWFAAVALGVSLTAAAQSAQDELEKQLKDMVAKPPSKLLVEYEGLDQPAYKLLDLSFVLDGQSLPVPAAIEKLNEGKTTIWHGDIKPGRHRLEYVAQFSDVSGVLFSYEAGYKFKVGSASTFEQQPGLEVRVLVTPELTPGEKDPRKKFTLKGTADVKMLAKLEDGTMPDVPKPNLPGADAADAGASTAEVAKMTPAERAKLVAAEKAAAKKAADEEKKRAREEALAAKKAAAEEKKRQRDEALAAKKAAAEEKKRQREEALAAKRGEKVATAEPVKADPGGKPAEPTPPVQQEPEGALAADAVDAGPPVAVADPVKPPEAVVKPPAAPAPEDKSSMLPIAIGGGVALLGVIVFLATRKKKSPPAV
jgi:hypothetical protein